MMILTSGSSCQIIGMWQQAPVHAVLVTEPMAVCDGETYYQLSQTPMPKSQKPWQGEILCEIQTFCLIRHCIVGKKKTQVKHHLENLTFYF